jgi:glucosamine--fructose-6-phosphate aminotransferase (isomerizing)
VTGGLALTEAVSVAPCGESVAPLPSRSSTLDQPDLVVGARRISPLIVGVADGASYLASDIPALLGSTRRLFALEDDQLVELRPGTLRVTTLDGHRAEPTALTVDWDLEAARQDGYDDFMTKEIHEQPEAVADTLLGPIEGRRDSWSSTRRRARRRRAARHRRVCIVACGSSYHAAWWPSSPSSSGPPADRGRHRQRVPLPATRS